MHNQEVKAIGAHLDAAEAVAWPLRHHKRHTRCVPHTGLHMHTALPADTDPVADTAAAVGTVLGPGRSAMAVQHRCSTRPGLRWPHSRLDPAAGFAGWEWGPC